MSRLHIIDIDEDVKELTVGFSGVIILVSRTKKIKLQGLQKTLFLSLYFHFHKLITGLVSCKIFSQRF